MIVETIPSEKLEKASEMLKAIAHPARISIVQLLGNDNKFSVTQIYEHLQMEQAVVSHHLGILRSRDVLASERNGKNSLYYLKHPSLINIVNCVAGCCD